MKDTSASVATPQFVSHVGIVSFVIAVVAIALQGCASKGPLTFASPADATQALVGALRQNDMSKVRQIFGPEGDDIVSSGDPVEDRNAAERFLAKYDAKHQLVPTVDSEPMTVTLQVGENDWPFPVPIVRNTELKWYFDAAEGKEEILNRRIGRNELSAIQVCLAIVDAEREYAMRDPDGDGLPNYAQKFISSPGTHDGLYWKVKEGEAPSPLGPLVAQATDEGYTHSENNQPYHGYYYRILKSQGSHARGGECDYLVKDKMMIGGFAVVAYPATYGNSGIMTFIVNHDGVVYQKDLGENTSSMALDMTIFDPDDTWTKVDPASAAAATQPSSS